MVSRAILRLGAFARRAFSLAVVMACCASSHLPAAFANGPDALITGSLPGGGGVTRHGRWYRGPHEAPPGRLFVLGFAGDLGFSGKDQPLSPAGAVRHGRVIPWEELVAGVAPLLGSDVTFANLETVITDRADLASVEKAFNFGASSAGLREAIKAGINVLAAANNHAADYGAAGIGETLRHLEAARADGLKAHAGLGKGDERYLSEVFDLHGTSVGLAAVGKGINPAGPGGFGQPLYASPSDFERVSRSLGSTQADVRVLSVHYNQELSLLPASVDRKRIRSAVDSGDATIVFGHHSHVASGVERRGDGLIFYGLGNFLHAGTQNMARYGKCRDFGLHARVYLWITPENKPVVRAIEVTPLRDMHEVTRPFPAEEAAIRIEIVNALSEKLSQDGGEAVRFLPTGTGSGLACFPGSAIYGDELEARCRAQFNPLMNVSSVPRVSLASCKPLPQVDLAAGVDRTKRKSEQLGEQASKTPKPSVKQASRKPDKAKAQQSKNQKKKSGKRFFLFSRAD
jgi:poly-gamma-glutamate capsule biosynthesis protein CapA/YwtB (metallophosphatase superfamily)